MSVDAATYRLGVDIGGTFTDAMLLDEETGAVRVAKVPSTPKDPSLAFLDVVGQILEGAEVDPAQVSFVVHGTTVATNTIIEGKGARTGFVTTAGFRDLLEIQRQLRPSLYDIKFEKPKPLVPRYWAREVAGRLDAAGEELVSLDRDAVREAARFFKEQGVESVALCYLHSYANPVHEVETERLFAEEFPEAQVSRSSYVAPEIREYFRASTTVINALVQPVVREYLTRIERRLRARGFDSHFLVMQSNGGVLTFAAASERPVFMIESGPAAGVNAAKAVGDRLRQPNVIAFDMGGTTAKAGMIRDGRAGVTKEFEVGAEAGTDRRGAGYPIRTPVIDLVEVGAGGGSIAWVDPGGVLRVGPRSSGADPGPACYGRGGELPTVADANLVLGRLDPANFLGGAMRLDPDASRVAIETHCARELEMDVVECALAIVELANVTMMNALRLVSVQRGYDPRDFVLVGFGGGGPAHATALARELGIPLTIVPRAPGVLNAMGLLVTDLVSEYSRTAVQATDGADCASLNAIYQDLVDRADAQLEFDAVLERAVGRYVEMRYVGQSHELTIEMPDGPVTPTGVAEAVTRFHDEHDRLYGYCAPDAATELVTLRLTATGVIRRAEMERIAPAAADGLDEATSGQRPVYFAQSGGFVPCPVVRRERLGAGATFVGPALIVELDSTTLVEPGWEACVDEWGNLLLSAPP